MNDKRIALVPTDKNCCGAAALLTTCPFQTLHNHDDVHKMQVYEYNMNRGYETKDESA